MVAVMRASASAVLVRLLLNSEALRRVDTDAVLARWQVTPADLEEPGARVEHGLVSDLFEAGQQADRHCGLHVAEQLGTGFMQVADFVARSSSTFEAALARVSRFHSLFLEGL